MPKSKRRKQKLGGKKVNKVSTLGKNQDSKPNYVNGDTNIKGQKSFANTFGSPRSSRSPISPSKINRSSARGR